MINFQFYDNNKVSLEYRQFKYNVVITFNK